jgi:hypothetical protein
MNKTMIQVLLNLLPILMLSSCVGSGMVRRVSIRFTILLLLVSCAGDSGRESTEESALAIPSAPTSLTFVTPGSSPGLDSTPTIQVEGVEGGNTVKLFSDSTCTTEIGSAVSSGTSVDVTVSTSLTPSTHTIYAASSNSSGVSSCSTESISYTLASCPPEFIPVPHNTDVGTTSDFCVMKYEAKAYHSVNQTIDADGCNEAGCTTANWGLAEHYPKSSSTGKPWRRISPSNASVECSSLNSLGESHYDLISNVEWMTIARNAENVSMNFQAGIIPRGYSQSNSSPASTTDSTCLYNNGGNSCSDTGDHIYKRTLTLSNGEDLWDLAGNVYEWVDWNKTESGFDLGPTTCASGWMEFSTVLTDACYLNANILGDQVFPLTENGESAEGFGRFNGGTGGAAGRGGFYANGANAGAFTLFLGYGDTYTSQGFGFRCVYRP